MITTVIEYESPSRASRPYRTPRQLAAGSKGFTKAGVGKTIARLHKELATMKAAKKSVCRLGSDGALSECEFLFTQVIVDV